MHTNWIKEKLNSSYKIYSSYKIQDSEWPISYFTHVHITDWDWLNYGIQVYISQNFVVINHNCTSKPRGPPGHKTPAVLLNLQGALKLGPLKLAFITNPIIWRKTKFNSLLSNNMPKKMFRQNCTSLTKSDKWVWCGTLWLLHCLLRLVHPNS